MAFSASVLWKRDFKNKYVTYNFSPLRTRRPPLHKYRAKDGSPLLFVNSERAAIFSSKTKH